MDLVLDRACAATRAWRGGDKAEIRSALAALADEAGMLAQMNPLPLPSPVARRQQISMERDRTPRSGTS
jgi:hypothetical protein